jgi:HAMP domain-containing protein
MMPFLVMAVVVVVAAVLVVVLARRRRPPDGMDSFRRQIDALSPEARRPTIRQMKPSERGRDDEDGARGT